MTSKAYIPNQTKTKTALSSSLWSMVFYHLRQRSWMLLLSALASFLSSPIAFLFLNTRTLSLRDKYELGMIQFDSYEDFLSMLSESLCQYFAGPHIIFQLVVLYVGVLIVSLCGFRYLFSQRTTDLYHSMPIPRNRLFLVNYLTGFVTWFAPFLMGHLCVYILMLFWIGNPAFWGGITAMMLKEILLLVLCFFILYNACLVPIMICGNEKSAVFTVLAYGLFVLIGYAAILLYMDGYFTTFYFADNMFLSPIPAIFAPFYAPVFLCVCFYERHVEDSLLGAATTDSSRLAAIFILILVVMAANFVLAMYLHKKRPSELAEHGVENRFFRITLRLLVSTLSGICLAWVFASLERSLWSNLIWVLFGAVLGCILAFCFTNILYHASFRAIFTHKRQLVICILAACGTVLFFHFDLPGYDTYVPKKENIQGVTIYSHYFYGPGYMIAKTEDGHYTQVNKLGIPSDLSFTDQDAAYRFLKAMADWNETQNVFFIPGGYSGKPHYSQLHYNIDVRVDTTSGSYYRSYSFYETEEIADALAPLTDNQEFVNYYNPLGCGLIGAPTTILPQSVDETGRTGLIEDPAAVQKIYNAYLQDFKEHYHFTNELSDFHLFSLQFNYYTDETDFQECTVPIPAWYSRTIAALQEIDPDSVWSQEDLNFKKMDAVVYTVRSGNTKEDLQVYLETGKAPADAEFTRSNLWRHTITDQQELEAIRPYLYLSATNPTASDEYLYVGTVYTTFDPSIISSDSERTFFCYLKRGEIPEGFIEELTLE